MHRASMAWAPEPSASVWEHDPSKSKTPRKTAPLGASQSAQVNNKASGSSIELTEIKSASDLNLPRFDEETFEEMVEDLEGRYAGPRPSAGDYYDDDQYEEAVSEDAYSFDSQDDEDEDENVF